MGIGILLPTKKAGHHSPAFFVPTQQRLVLVDYPGYRLQQIATITAPGTNTPTGFAPLNASISQSTHF